MDLSCLCRNNVADHILGGANKMRLIPHASSPYWPCCLCEHAQVFLFELYYRISKLNSQHFSLTFYIEMVKNFRGTQQQMSVEGWTSLAGYRAEEGSEPSLHIYCQHGFRQNKETRVRGPCKVLIALHWGTVGKHRGRSLGLCAPCEGLRVAHSEPTVK